MLKPLPMHHTHVRDHQLDVPFDLFRRKGGDIDDLARSQFFVKEWVEVLGGELELMFLGLELVQTQAVVERHAGRANVPLGLNFEIEIIGKVYSIY